VKIILVGFYFLPYNRIFARISLPFHSMKSKQPFLRYQIIEAFPPHCSCGGAGIRVRGRGEEAAREEGAGC